MSGTPTERPAGRMNVRCPTCGQWQEWSDSCRRCKCDLLLLPAMEAVRAAVGGASGRCGSAAPRPCVMPSGCTPFRRTAQPRGSWQCHVLCGNWTEAIATWLQDLAWK